MIDVARMLTNTFAGIAPTSVPMFVLMQLVGAAGGVVAVAALYPDVTQDAIDVVIPHAEEKA
jgi:arsenate reductase